MTFKEREIRETKRGFKEKERFIEKLFGQCFEISTLQNNDKIPVGGVGFFPDSELNIEVICDFDNFNDLWKEIQNERERYNLQKLSEWLKKQGIEIDEKLFASLFAFTKTIERKYPEIFERRYQENLKRSSIRERLYQQHYQSGKEIKLSEVFKENAAECAEIAALAQYFLQQKNINSSYFSGEVLWDKNEEFSGRHTFIVIRHGEKTYIYDPANPIETTQGKFPNIYSVEANFDKEVRRGQQRFVVAKNIYHKKLKKKEAYFGVNDGRNIKPENIVEK